MNNQIDTSIPILTEIITAPAKPKSEANDVVAAPDDAAQPEPLQQVLPSTQPSLETAPPPPSNKPGSSHSSLGIRMINTAASVQLETTSNTQVQADDEKNWRALEQQVREAVLKQLLTRVDFVLEHRVRDNLADVLQLAVASLTNDIRSGLEKTLEDLISRAITQEINKIRQIK